MRSGIVIDLMSADRERLDRRSRQNHRRCKARAPSVRFDPLAGFDELERLARLEGDAFEIQAGTSDIAAVTGTIVSQL